MLRIGLCYLSLLFTGALFSGFVSAEQDFNQAFDTFTERNHQVFEQFVSDVDAEFLLMLKQNWQEFDAMPGLKRDNTPKPRLVPHIRETSATQAVSDPDFSHVAIESEPLHVVHKKGVTQFYGHELVLPLLYVPALKSIDETGLQHYWEEQLKHPSKEVLTHLENQIAQLALSDWAVWQLVKSYTHTLNITDEQAIAVSWFLLSKLGLDVKIAYQHEGLVLLGNFKQAAYELTYFKIEDQSYFLIAGKQQAKGVKTYRGKHKQANQPFNLSFNKTLITEPKVKHRHLAYSWQDKRYKLDIPYDLARIKFLRGYPQVDLALYFSAPLDSLTSKALKAQLSEQLVGSPDNKINQLLALTHQALPYAIDELQFGQENYLLIEETLHYQASDCEDRSILFAWIARELLKEKVVALDYPGHISIAISRNDKLLSADPTYIGSKLGDVMPKYQSVKPKILAL